jgi:hypothetical protein
MLRLENMVRFVDDHERRSAMCGHEALEVKAEKFRRRADDVPGTGFERVHQFGAFGGIDRAVSAKNAQP